MLVSTTYPKSHFMGLPLVRSQGEVPGWTSPRLSYKSENNSLGLPLVSSQTLQSEVTGPHPESQMVMDIRKQLKTTTFIIPNNFCFNNIAKKSFLGTPPGQVPDLAVWGGWTSPRCSWTSGNNLKQLLSSSPTTFVSTTLPKSHSLGLPLVRS